MKAWLLLPALALLLVTGCTDNQDVGKRYRMERGLWQTNKEVRRLSLRPELVDDAEWRQIATRYENLVSRQDEAPNHSEAGTTRDIRLLEARALINAAQIYATIGDSIPMLETYQRVAKEFDDLNEVAVEVAMARGQIAEATQQWQTAAAHFQFLLDRLEPAPGDPGVAGALTVLPISIARLKVKDALTTPADSSRISDRVHAFYEQARSQYNDWIAAQPGTRLELESLQQLASIETDLGNWVTAISHLRSLENKLFLFEEPPFDPAQVRYGIARTQARVESLADSSKATLTALIRDYPDSPVVAEALLNLALVSPAEEALSYLDRLRNDHRNSGAYQSQGQLLRARVLESAGRWAEANEVLRSLPLEQPVSEVALQAPMQIVQHYQRLGDEQGLADALTKAERQYRESIERYPAGYLSLAARGKLIDTLYLQKRYEEAISEILALSEEMGNAPGAAPLMLDAAKMARDDLGDTSKAVEILERTVALYADTEAGRWAADEAARLQGGVKP